MEETNTSDSGAARQRSKQDMITIPPPSCVRTGTNVLNRALFNLTLDLVAASPADPRRIGSLEKSLIQSRELFHANRLRAIVHHPDKALGDKGKKCLILNPKVKIDEPDTWGPVVREGFEKKELGLVPYKLNLNYDYWTSPEVLKALLPEEFHDDLPRGFNTAGHIAHLNLQSRHEPYKRLIAEVILDKVNFIRTVINKTEDVGAASEFRTFPYEVLAGPDDMQVTMSENGCIFEFDYSKVYWNSKLEPEHTRLIRLFQPGEVVCDVMAGIGPFALPAGKKGVFVWANDKNPEGYAALVAGAKKNKVSQFVRSFNRDGRDFIHEAADSVLEASKKGEVALVPVKTPKGTRTGPRVPPQAPQRIPVPPVISHFVMNLPALAITFLRHYRGLYHGQEALFEPVTKAKMPMVHTHCFAIKTDDTIPEDDISERVSAELGFRMKPGNPENEGEMAIQDVRDVSPSKHMFCVSFRIPREIAFAPRA